MAKKTVWTLARHSIGVVLLLGLMHTGCTSRSIDLEAEPSWMAILHDGGIVQGSMSDIEKCKSLVTSEESLFVFEYYGQSPVVQKESRYEEGRLVYHVSRTISGQRTSEWLAVERDGGSCLMHQTFHPNMVLESERFYKEVEGKRVRCGTWRTWDAAGRQRSETSYTNVNQQPVGHPTSDPIE